MGVSLFSQATCDRMRGQSSKLCERQLRLYIRKNYFMNRLPRKVVGPLSLERQGTQCYGLVDRALFGQMLDPVILEVFSNLNDSETL